MIYISRKSYKKDKLMPQNQNKTRLVGWTYFSLLVRKKKKKKGKKKAIKHQIAVFLFFASGGKL